MIDAQLERCAAALRSATVRIVLGVSGFVASLVLVPSMLFAIFILLSSFTSDALNRRESLGWGLIGFFGLVSFVAGWARIILSPTQIRSNRRLRHTIAAGLSVGMVLATILVVNEARRAFDSPLGLFAIGALGIGSFLLAATLGERAAGDRGPDARTVDEVPAVDAPARGNSAT